MTASSTKAPEPNAGSDSALSHRAEYALPSSAVEATVHFSREDATHAAHETPWHAHSLIDEQSRTRRIIIAGMAIVIGLAVWCFWPLSSPEIPTPVTSPQRQPAQTQHSFDSKPFDSMMWSLAALPPPPPAPPPPPPAVKAQLVAITQSAGGQYQATLYDPDTDKLVTVREGEAVGRRIVTKLTKSSVTLTYTSDVKKSSTPHHHVLSLDTPPSDSGGK